MSLDLILAKSIGESEIAVDEKLIASIQAVLDDAACVLRVASLDEQKEAVAAQQSLHAVAGAIEKARKKLKDPVLDLGRRIDAKAKELSKDLVIAQDRIMGLLSDFQAQLVEEARKAEEARQAELRRIEEERLAELRRIAAEEAKRKAEAEAIRRAAEEAAAKADSEAKRQAMLAEAERMAKAAEEASRKEMTAALERAAQAAEAVGGEVTAARADGQRVVERYVGEVFDVHALYRFNPRLVRLEPAMSEINDLLVSKGQEIEKGTYKVPGLRVYRETKSTVTGRRKEIGV